MNSKSFQGSDFDFSTSPWSTPVDPTIKFPIEFLEKLLVDLGWSEPFFWLEHWLKRGGIDLASSFWPAGAKPDWIWGLGLPLLSDLERYFANQDGPIFFGLSGLPGCGKTSLGKWLEAAAGELKWPLTVMSMDDFYLPALQLEREMSGNPWNVPRALPGSHSIQLLEETIENWMKCGELIAPQFDKALRSGRGDRIGWRCTRPKLVILEGWFLGCSLAGKASKDSINEDNLSIPLTSREYEYREIVQEKLKSYQLIWNKFKRLWHIKATSFNATIHWRTQQEMNMLGSRGVSLQGESLDSFLRMIQVAIPQESLQSIEADVVVRVNPWREITWVGRWKDEISC